MSIGKVENQEVESLMARRRQKGNTIKSSEVIHRLGGVGVGSMLRRASVGGREISHCRGLPPTMGTSSAKTNKIQAAMREVESLRSSRKGVSSRIC